MAKKEKLIIGSRGSKLALWQSNFIKNEIEKKNKKITVEVKLIKTKGDKILDVALSKIGDKALFTKELEVALLDGKIDLAVHSLKDLPTLVPDGLEIAAITKRHPAGDVLIARKKGTTIDNLREGAVVGTGSLRRSSQLRHLRPDIITVDLRGNVPTRIEKFLKSEWDAIILARAGVERLKLNKYISSFIDVNVMLPAVGQGALGLETRKNDERVKSIISAINHEETNLAAQAERAFLKTLEGGCQVPIGAYAQVKSNGLYLEGWVGSLDGSIAFRAKIRGSKNEPEEIGKHLAIAIKKAGAGKVLAEIFADNR